MHECKTSGFRRIIRVIWESLCPYEIRWGIDEEAKRRNFDGGAAEFGQLAKRNETHGPQKDAVQAGGVILPHA